jgi:hypothetical protein
VLELGVVQIKLTQIGNDYIRITEDNMYDEKLINIPRVHLIKLDFFSPNEEKVKTVIKNFPKTNRYVIEDNIRTYNFILKRTNKKYYVCNKKGVDVISFFRKNNKVLVNFHNLHEFEKVFLLSDRVFADVLRNVEVIQIDKQIFDEKIEVLENWRGNVVVSSDKDII